MREQVLKNWIMLISRPELMLFRETELKHLTTSWASASHLTDMDR